MLEALHEYRNGFAEDIASRERKDGSEEPHRDRFEPSTQCNANHIQLNSPIPPSSAAPSALVARRLPRSTTPATLCPTRLSFPLPASLPPDLYFDVTGNAP